MGERQLSTTRQLKPADIIALACAAGLLTIFVFLHRAQLLSAPRHTLAALGITIVFAVLARVARGVNLGGALAGAAVAFIMAERELRMFALLLIVFALTLAATRWGMPTKRRMHAAEMGEGRSAAQVMANLGLAALVMAVFPPAWYVLAAAALAELTADTSSSEIGMVYPGRTVLITSWKPVPPGTDGGISLSGTVAGCLAAAIVAVTAMWMGLSRAHHAGVIVYSGILGMLVDSVLGALVERRGWLNNDVVNLISTGAAIGIARMLM